MEMLHKEDFIKGSVYTLGEILDMLSGIPQLKIKDLPSENTVMVIVDMINGFAREGMLKSPRVEALIPEVARLSRLCEESGILKIAFADCHNDTSPEFTSYPSHCLAGTHESEVVDEIKAVGGYKLIPKNSTNGFLEDEFQSWLKYNPQIDTFIVTGDCTDICVQQFAVTLKAWFNKQNRKSRIIIPANAVDTYDLGVHNGDFMHVVALYNMISNGIEVVIGIGK